MPNPLFSFLSGGNDAASILLQAVGAAMRGESAQDFMSRLANQRPELRQINLNDLQGSAQALCQQKGIDANELSKKIDGVIEPVIKR
jgi:hypothetical protein